MSCRRGSSRSTWTPGSAVTGSAAIEVTHDILHMRYQSSVDDAHGHGPLEAGRATLVGASVLSQYANTIASGPIPPSVLYSPEEMSPEQAANLRDDWVAERVANPGYPGVLTGGLRLETTQLSPKEMALIEIAQYTDSKIAVLLGVPPPLVGLPTAGDSLTYNTVLMALEQHWRTGLRPKATAVMAGLSANGCCHEGQPSRSTATPTSSRSRLSGPRPRRFTTGSWTPRPGGPCCPSTRSGRRNA